MKVKQYIVPAIGVAAFVIGGAFSRAKALESIDTIADRLRKDKKKLKKTSEESESE